MADLIGHPWMQGTVATSEQVRAEFMKRQETVKARALEDQEHKQAEKSKQTNAARTRRGEQIDDKIYVTEQFTDKEVNGLQVVKLNLKPFNTTLKSNTSFFTDYKADQVLKQLVDVLVRQSVKYEISDKTWKINFTKDRNNADKKKNEQMMVKESAGIQIDILDAGDNKLCVEFKRKSGSAMIFYDVYNMILEEIAHVNNIQV